MAKRHYFRDFVVGIVFLGSLVLVAYATLWLERVPWARAYAVEVRFPEVDSLQRGEPVLIHGVRIGQVSDIDYDRDNNNVRVTLSLEHDLSRQLTRETRFAIRSAGPLGGRVLEIEPRPGPLPEPGSQEVYVGEAERDVFKELSRLSDLLSGVVSDNRENLRETIADLRAIAERIEQGQGLLGQVINDPAMAADAKQLVADARSFLRSLDEGEGLLSALVKDSELKASVEKLVKDVGGAVAPEASEKGTIGALLHDQKLRDDLKNAAAKASEVMDGVQEIVDKVRRGEGLLGKLLYDEELWQEIVRVVVIARESLEDLREQAPINTFANVLFTAF
jgi:phospholipid/cholesterol/gamma-HCH transport system substrate-binding protein